MSIRSAAVLMMGGVACGLALPALSLADDASLKNWFNDPFFQVRAARPDCPVPLGPLLRESDIRAEAHYRVERGTSCWLAGQCAQPNAYFYDAAIGAAVRQRFAGLSAFADASLWVTVKRRFVWIEGCVADAGSAAALEAAVRDLPDVEMVLVNVMRPGAARPPYAVLPAGVPFR